MKPTLYSALLTCALLQGSACDHPLPPAPSGFPDLPVPSFASDEVIDDAAIALGYQVESLYEQMPDPFSFRRKPHWQDYPIALDSTATWADVESFYTEAFRHPPFAGSGFVRQSVVSDRPSEYQVAAWSRPGRQEGTHDLIGVAYVRYLSGRGAVLLQTNDVGIPTKQPGSALSGFARWAGFAPGPPATTADLPTPDYALEDAYPDSSGYRNSLGGKLLSIRRSLSGEYGGSAAVGREATSGRRSDIYRVPLSTTWEQVCTFYDRAFEHPRLQGYVRQSNGDDDMDRYPPEFGMPPANWLAVWTRPRRFGPHESLAISLVTVTGYGPTGAGPYRRYLLLSEAPRRERFAPWGLAESGRRYWPRVGARPASGLRP